MKNEHVIWFETLKRSDLARVGGKNASLGELIGALQPKGINVPPGFATTAAAYRRFIEHNGLGPVIESRLAELSSGQAALAESGGAIRTAIRKGEWPDEIEAAIRAAYRKLAELAGDKAPSVAVRSSATAEDLPDASFAGQQETFLNIEGEDDLMNACRRCYASLFTDRAISYREAKGFAHEDVALSVGVQRMVRSDRAGAGVMFSIDTESGFEHSVLINAAWGLGENVVQGAVDPDEYQVFKPLLENEALSPIVAKKRGAKTVKMIYAERGETPTRNVSTSKEEQAAFVLSDEEILTLARWAVAIERHYECAMDMEWAKDGPGGNLFIVQARPETVQAQLKNGGLESYRLRSRGETLVRGAAIGEAVVTGRVGIIESASEISNFEPGSVLVTGTTDPDWVPIMKQAAAIVTDHGGRTSHAAIVSRELGLPAIVGTGDATRLLYDGQDVTVSCAEGDEGFVYQGIADFEVETLDLGDIPETRTKVMLNLANPAAAYRWWRLPADGVGLVRMEFVINNEIKVHPMALVHPQRVDAETRARIGDLTHGYADGGEYFVDRLSRGLARIAAVQHPKPVIVRMSDFKTNEYAGLVGGAEFEPREENPMIGFRGASRYYSEAYREGFALECRAIRRLREEIGLSNVIVMIPFCRSTREADRVLEEMARNGLERGENGLEVYVMCEIPSNAVLAAPFAERFDGFSIGSNDLTQLTLGIDRDSELLADQFDEQDEAVKWMIRHVIEEAHRHGTKVGLCGQAPSDHPEFARFLVECGIDSISVSPDSFIEVKRHISAAESAN
ncbi:phosphoenolpyruvate synthase [Erythrobacter sp.]|uniref:phosphoenolpyruvate synthase n=1 Tax=Erythrobacter sp. TaxID=1042 RepID=UPI001425D0DE|nr:phosphoenolpyruvate synthase [Erythrobacter sp.]QIQ87975.1 MAG: phosphoenolpyruvate synthase [Erythrobacter sp.]